MGRFRKRTNECVLLSQEFSYNCRLQKTKQDVHSALSDNFNTPLAIQHLKDLVHKTNKYIEVEKAPKSNLIRSVGLYITYMFKVVHLYSHIYWQIFGLIDNQEIGYITSDTNVSNVHACADC